MTLFSFARVALASASVFCAGFISVASAHDYKLGPIMVQHPYAIETPKMVKSGGGYMHITNRGTEADALVAVKANFPQVMLHKTDIKDGIARMPHMQKITLPAGETVTFEPGGLHVMFMGLNGDPFEVGESIPATLIFEKAGALAVTFKVEPRKGKKATKQMDHSGHAMPGSQHETKSHDKHAHH